MRSRPSRRRRSDRPAFAAPGDRRGRPRSSTSAAPAEPASTGGSRCARTADRRRSARARPPSARRAARRAGRSCPTGRGSVPRARTRSPYVCRARPLAAYVATVVLALACCASASAAPLGLNDCAPAQGVYQCSGLVKTWDGVPLDTTVTLPSATLAGPLPLIADIHGFGNSKWEYLNPDDQAYTGNAYTWAKAGYAVLTYTARGLWGSCGTPDARAADPIDCAHGYIHLADARYEARDTQELIGRLVDDGTADAKRIGVTGDSYGGGQSLELAALRNRVMQPDGSLAPWRTPKGTPLSLAAAAPVIPWSDLLGAIAPNGRTLTYARAPIDATYSPPGVFKTSF